MNGTIQTIIITGIIFLLSACANPPMISPEENLPETSSAESASPQEITEPEMADSEEIDTAQQPVATPATIAESVSQSPLAPPTVTPLAAEPPTPDVSQSQPPFCEFKKSAEADRSPSQLDEFIFSEPRVILSHKGPIEISQWLSDNQQVLISRENTDTGVSSIETININTREIVKHGEGRLFGSMPPAHKFVWLDATSTTAYVTIDNNNRYALQTSQEGKLIETLSAQVASAYIAAHPDGGQLTFVSKSISAQPHSFDVTTKKVQALSVKGVTDSSETEESVNFWSQYQSAWHPDGKTLAYFNNQAFFLFTTENGEICELDLGTIPDYGKQWALFAQWSPDGQYLAIRRTVGEPSVPFIDLTIINIETGELRTLDIGNRENIYAIDWGATSRDILVVAQEDTRQNPTIMNGHNVYIVDTITGNYRQILQQDSEFFFSGNSGVSWASNGEHIALMCPTFLSTEPTLDEGRLCIIDVEVN